MFRKILGTIGAKTVNACFSLVLVMVNANYLGAEGVGIISLIILGITFLLLINNFIGGAALVYLTPRIRTINLLIPAYVWAVCTALIFYAIVQLIPIVPGEYNLHVVFLGFLQSIGTIHLNILLGNKKILIFNIITTLQISLTVILVYVFYSLGAGDIRYFITALYCAYIFTCVSSMLFTVPGISFSGPLRFAITVRTIFRYGGYTQIGNIFQLLNYRSAYYFIEAMAGKSALGLFSVSTQLSEGVLLISRSISIIQYAHIANSRDLNESQRLTTLLMKLTFVTTAILLCVLIMIPGSVYGHIFGREFQDIPIILICLFLGIVALSVLNIGSHYFSGIGKHHINSMSSGIGFIFIIIFCLILIPAYGLPGAAIATSISYILSSLFVLIVFLREIKSGPKALMINREDIRLIKRQILKQLNR